MPANKKLDTNLDKLSAIKLSGPLESVLIEIATFASRAIPGADGAGLALIEANRPNTVVASAEFVREVDQVQYGLDEGPCLQAISDQRYQMSGGLSKDPRWPHFGPEAARLGVESVLSLPLISSDKLVGTLNVYGMAPDSFDPESVRIGQFFAGPAGVSVANAQLLDETQRLADGLTSELTDQAAIQQAVGIVMARTGADAAVALETLRALGRSDQTDLVAAAHRLRADPMGAFIGAGKG